VTEVTPSAVIPQQLGTDDQAAMTELWQQLAAKQRRNILRRKYYDAKAGLRDLGISIPPQLRNVEVALGAPAKGVDSMSRRTILEGFTAADAETADLGLDDLWTGNRMEIEAPNAHTSALIRSCAFGFVTQGDVEAGEPPALITTRSAEFATGMWDRRRRSLRSALSVTEVDEAGVPTEMNMYLPNRTVIMRSTSGGRWDLRQVEHDLGVPVELLAYKAELDRPFGRSRITRPVMYLTDAMVRTALRTEVSAEFYNAPQRYALGADEEAFKAKDGTVAPAWQVLLGRMLTLSRDEEGELPTVGQFAQQSMVPNLDQMRSLAQQLAMELSLPVGSLGIVQDNPSSAEAIKAAWEELGTEIEHWQRTALSPAWESIVRMALSIVDDSPAAMATYRTIRARWGAWSTPSEVSRAQASAARVQANPRLAGTDVELEKQGFTDDEIRRIKAQWAREASRSSLAALTASAAGRSAPAAEPQESSVATDAAAQKAQFDALGVAIRAGVDPDDAARRLGLDGIQFTGAVPVSLRLPESEAAELEEA
jgi:hypothetical protein